ncbi:MAG: hypothetical protein ACUVV3_10310, partial [Dehalococcoidia bacterium]
MTEPTDTGAGQRTRVTPEELLNKLNAVADDPAALMDALGLESLGKSMREGDAAAEAKRKEILGILMGINNSLVMMIDTFGQGFQRLRNDIVTVRRDVDLIKRALKRGRFPEGFDEVEN